MNSFLVGLILVVGGLIAGAILLASKINPIFLLLPLGSIITGLFILIADAHYSYSYEH